MDVNDDWDDLEDLSSEESETSGGGVKEVYVAKTATVIYATVGTKSKKLVNLPSRAQVTRVGRESKLADGHLWIKVSYMGKTGWTVVNYLQKN